MWSTPLKFLAQYRRAVNRPTVRRALAPWGVILLLALARQLPLLLPENSNDPEFIDPAFAEMVTFCAQADSLPVSAGTADFESILACGGRLPLSRIDGADLTIVRLLSERQREELLARKADIAAFAWGLPVGEEWQAFTGIRGVGMKKAREVGVRINPLR